VADRFMVSWTDIACNVTALPGKTIAQITNPSTQRIWITELLVTFDGATATAVPVNIRLARQTTAGTPSGNTTPTPVLMDAGGPASLQTAVVAGAAAWTTEPTLGDILWTPRQPPTSGIGWQWPLGREPVIAVSARVAVIVTAAATVNCTGHICWEG
jgi:hypothetical protein